MSRPENSQEPEPSNNPKPNRTRSAKEEVATRNQEQPKKQKKSLLGKFITLFMLLIILVAIWFGYKMLNPSIAGPRINPLNLVPENALFILETDEPYRAWSELSKTALWDILQKDQEWKAYGTALSDIENTLSGFDQALDLLTNRTVYISGHLYKKGQLGYLYLLDLGGMAALATWLSHSENVTTRTFQQNTIYEKFDSETKETLYFTIVDDMLVASYVHVLVEASINEKEQATLSRSLDFIDIRKKVAGEGLIRMYLNYDIFYSFLDQSLSKNDVATLRKEIPFLFSGFYFDVEDDFMSLEGSSNFNDQQSTYLSLFSKSGIGKMDIAQIAPENTSIFLSFGFESFAKFYENLSEQLSLDPALGEGYTSYTEKTEKFLDIDLKSDFADWIDDEIAIIQIETGMASSSLALVFKGKNASLVEEKMSFLTQQIKRKTPVRFRAVDYKGYSINYMSVKGFFNLMLGVLFNRFDRPYYTIINEFVVFSNEPQVLRRIIDGYQAEKTMSILPSFKKFQNELGEKHSALLYLQLELLKNSHDGLLDDETVKLIQSKNSLLSHFPQIGFKISPSGELFKTTLLLSVNSIDPAELIANNFPNLDKVNYDSIWQLDPGEQIEIDKIEISDLGAKKQSEEYEEGTPKFEVELKDGLRHGDYFEYHPTGELKIKGKYKADLKEGTWKFYDVDGKLIKKDRYKKGDIVK
jgi:hypothetical protein